MTDKHLFESAREFIKKLEALSGARSTAQLFDDFLEIGFTSIAAVSSATAPDKKEAYLARYDASVARWGAALPKVAELMAFAEIEASGFKGDFLGVVAQEIGTLSAQQGQFFTPSILCDLMAALVKVTPDSEVIQKNGWFGMAEPACGSGAMIIAKAKRATANGIHVPTQMFVEATDISERAFKMCYLQMTFNGIPALVRCADTLTQEEPLDTILTPAFTLFNLAISQFYKGVLAAGGADLYAEFREEEPKVHPVRKRVRNRK